MKMRRPIAGNLAALIAGLLLGLLLFYWSDWFFSQFQTITITIEFLEKGSDAIDLY